MTTGEKIGRPRADEVAALGLALAVTALGESRARPAAAERQKPREASGARPPAGQEPPQPAATPAEIPTQGWKSVLWRTWEGFGKDRIQLVAAGVTFYVLLAIFPAISALVSLYGFFADRATLSGQLGLLQGVMPGGGLDLLQEQATRIASSGQSALSLAFVFGLGVSVWSANAGMKGLFEAMNVVYEEDETRSFVTLNLRSLAFTFGALLFVLLALAAIVVAPIALKYFGLEQTGASLVALGRWPLLFLALVLALAVLYRYGPSRKPTAAWRWISWGSVTASALWLVVSILFSWYVASFGSYNATYGSLGAAIGFMTWIWLSVTVVLIGGELNSQIERQAGRKTEPD